MSDPHLLLYVIRLLVGVDFDVGISNLGCHGYGPRGRISAQPLNHAYTHYRLDNNKFICVCIVLRVYSR